MPQYLVIFFRVARRQNSHYPYRPSVIADQKDFANFILSAGSYSDLIQPQSTVKYMGNFERQRTQMSI